jgi:type IV secretory pathway TrbD component
VSIFKDLAAGRIINIMKLFFLIGILGVWIWTVAVFTNDQLIVRCPQSRRSFILDLGFELFLLAFGGLHSIKYP